MHKSHRSGGYNCARGWVGGRRVGTFVEFSPNTKRWRGQGGRRRVPRVLRCLFYCMLSCICGLPLHVVPYVPQIQQPNCALLPVLSLISVGRGGDMSVRAADAYFFCMHVWFMFQTFRLSATTAEDAFFFYACLVHVSHI